MLTTPSSCQKQTEEADNNTIIQTCTSTYVLLYEKEAVNIVNRCSAPQKFVPMQLLQEENDASRGQEAAVVSCRSMHPGVPVNLPQRPSTGIVNTAVREAALQEYAKNPLVFTVRIQEDGKACIEEEEDAGTMSSSSRHFMGFGFSKEMPYFPPGTLIEFVHRDQRFQHLNVVAKITGMVVAYGHRSQEFAVMFSLDRPVHVDAVSLFLESYNITEIDGGDDGFCSCLANIIRKYMYTVGDVDPCCVSTDAMESVMARKFQGELERMCECIQIAIATACSSSSSDDDEEEKSRRAECIRCAFRTYRQTLFLQMRHQPLGTREWIQMFESYMTFSAAEHGLGFLDFVLY